MSMKYTKIHPNTFKRLGMNAGLVLRDFDVSDGSYSQANMLGPSTGGINFTATPSFVDFGEDIDNCPKNTKELKQLEDWEVNMSGTFIAITPDVAQSLAALADIDGNNAAHIIPRSTLAQSDFIDLWLVGDYSDVNSGTNAGFLAIHLMNALSTGGFQIQTADKEKMQFAFEFTGHFSLDAQDTVPFEIYVQAGTSGNEEPEILLDRHSMTIAVNEEVQLNTLRVVPAGSTVTWNSSTTAKATVTNGKVKGVAAGNSIITASITADGVTYNDTCTVVVTAS